MRTRLLALSLLSLSLFSSSFLPCNAAPAHKVAPKKVATAPAKKAVAVPSKPINKASYEHVGPLDVLKNPEQWLNKKVTFNGTFNSFDAYALDYKGAFRDSKDYVAVLIRRPDAPSHNIPLSELKMLYPRAKSKAVRDLEPGDKVEIFGKVFSTALGDPWLDLDEVTITEKTPNSKHKADTDKPKP